MLLSPCRIAMRSANGQGFVRASLVVCALRASGAALNIGFALLVARKFGPRSLGTLHVALTALSIASVVGKLGLDTALMRLVAKNAAQGAFGAIRPLYFRSMLVTSICCAAVTVVAFLGFPVVLRSGFGSRQHVAAFYALQLAIVPTALLHVHAALLRGMHRITSSVFFESVAVLCVATPTVALLPAGSSVAQVAFLYLAATTLASVAAVWRWSVILRQLRNSPTKPATTPRLLTAAVPFFYIAVAGILTNGFDSLLLGICHGAHALGVYSALLRSSCLVSFVLASANTVLAPKFAVLLARGRLGELERLSKRAALLTTLAAIPLLLLCLCFPKYVLGCFGSEFIRGATALRLMALGQFVNVSTGSAGCLLAMACHERTLRNCVLLSSLASVTLDLVLIPPCGVLGAVVASTITSGALNLSLLAMVYAHLSLLPVPFSTPTLARRQRRSIAGYGPSMYKGRLP